MSLTELTIKNQKSRTTLTALQTNIQIFRPTGLCDHNLVSDLQDILSNTIPLLLVDDAASLARRKKEVDQLRKEHNQIKERYSCGDATLLDIIACYRLPSAGTSYILEFADLTHTALEMHFIGDAA